jgi:N-ethylmaleimide reductase
MKTQSILLDSFKLNNLLTLKNRIVMAPMTRLKADDHYVPTASMAEYYARRADAGLIVTEGTVIAPNGRGYNNVPGLFNEAQIEGWRHVTEAVHFNKGLIFAQIWHVGRVSHPSLQHGELPISASETMMSGRIARTENLTFGQSRAATLAEIEELIQAYANAATNAIKAGFDGIEIHGANGYLVDQFLHYDTNKRIDEYGGNSENMARFAIDIVKACGEAIGYERVGIRLSPAAYLNEITQDRRDADVFAYLLSQLNYLPIAYVHTGNFNDAVIYAELNNMTMSGFIRTHYKGFVIGCGSYTFEAAEHAVSSGEFDLIALGRPFIANPDLVSMLHAKEELRPYDVSLLQTLY